MKNLLNWLVPLFIGAPDMISSNVPYLNDMLMIHKTLFLTNSNFPKTFEKGIGSYLAGLWEGDGHVVLPSLDQKGCLKNTPCLCITAHSRQLPLFQVFKDKFGGWIRYKTKENAIVWTVTARADLWKVVTLINGNIRSPKFDQFNLLIDYLNRVSHSSIIQKHPLSCSSFLENYWLAGFIDADGSFKIRCTKDSVNLQTRRKIKQRIALSFSLEQRKNYKNNSFEPLMQNIANFLTVNLRTSKHNGVGYWCIEVASFRCLQVLMEYLEIYPLLTTKRNDYDDFLKAFRLILNNQHLTPEGKKAIFELKNGMNRKRIIYNWDHLS